MSKRRDTRLLKLGALISRERRMEDEVRRSFGSQDEATFTGISKYSTHWLSLKLKLSGSAGSVGHVFSVKVLLYIHTDADFARAANTDWFYAGT